MILKKLREFHNSIKKQYIDKYTTKQDTRLLDLACGKGGDIYKWNSNSKIIFVLGLDYNEDSIKEAKKRLKKAHIKSKKIIFKVQDLSKISLNCFRKYDVITSYFAFHYFFKNASSLNTILKSINNCSSKDTILIIALFDGDLLTNIKTDNFEISIKSNKNKYYNNQVQVYIKDSVLDVPEIEYIVKKDFLIKKMSSINFELIELKSFSEISTSKLDDDEKILSFLNNIYVFKKSI